MTVRIWKKNGNTEETVINTKEEMNEIETLAQKYGWELDILGRRPW